MVSFIEQVKLDYYTLGEASKVIEYNPATIWKWIKKGKIKAENLGREVLIEKVLIDAISKNTRKTYSWRK